MQLPTGSTELLALFGGDLRYSPSPQTHSHWAHILRLNLVYLPLTCKSEQDFMRLVSALVCCPQFKGGNITNPFKKVALQLPNIQIEESARVCGAANTLHRCENNWKLSNTDLIGCLESLRTLLKGRPDSFRVFILGDGAMAETVSAAMKLLSVELRITPRHVYRFNRTDLTHQSYNQLILEPTDLGLCINTLPTATRPDANVAASAFLNWMNTARVALSHALFEMSYLDTMPTQFARANNWAVEDGTRLFEIQARESFKLWTSHLPPSGSGVQWQSPK